MATTCKCGSKTVTVKAKRASPKRVSAKKPTKAGAKGGTKGGAQKASALSKKLSAQATKVAKKNASGCRCSGGSK